MKKIIVDVDDVTLNYVPALVRYMNAELGTNLRKRDIKSWALASHFPVDQTKAQRTFESFHRTEEFANLRLVRWAKQEILELTEQAEIYFVTSRGDELRNQTEGNLKMKLPEIWQDILYSNWGSKVEIYRKIKPWAVIDDGPHYVEEALEHGINAWLYNEPWNQDVNGAANQKRVQNWREFMRKIA